MQAGVGLLVSDVMPIYMIIPRYSHNYAQFCQLFNSNLFTHSRILMLLTEATSETYGPRVSFSSYQSPSLYYCFAFLLYLLLFTLHLYTKNIISIRSHSCKWPYRDWQPLFALVVRIYLFCAGARDSHVASYWIDTLQKLREILTLLCCIIPSSLGKSNARSRRSMWPPEAIWAQAVPPRPPFSSSPQASA